MGGRGDETDEAANLRRQGKDSRWVEVGIERQTDNGPDGVSARLYLVLKSFGGAVGPSDTLLDAQARTYAACLLHRVSLSGCF